jgi:hypothetical protein
MPHSAVDSVALLLLDERLEALPTAERTIEEQERHGIDR